MKKIFYTGLFFFLAFEFIKVFLIMPMPGSQTMNSIGFAYFLHSYRWYFRILIFAMTIAGSAQAFRGNRKWLPFVLLLIASTITYLLNFRMSADKMFQQTKNVELKPKLENKLPGSRLVIGIENNGEAKAYPVAFLAYHHQVLDRVGGKPVMITYCSVCRSGRVYEPVVNGHYENFRLVGMDHFNALFEDESTGSWWRQATGEAVTGKLKGNMLTEVASEQMTIDKWFETYPSGQVMQADEAFLMMYDSLAKFEQGKSKGTLTRTDSVSWKEKSWIVGVRVGNSCKAYDWNDLKKQRIINDTINHVVLFLVLSSDEQSFAVFEQPEDKILSIRNDTLISDKTEYDFSGHAVKIPSNRLHRIQAYQEFWHSWLSFHPDTRQFVWTYR